MMIELVNGIGPIRFYKENYVPPSFIKLGQVLSTRFLRLDLSENEVNLVQI